MFSWPTPFKLQLLICLKKMARFCFKISRSKVKPIVIQMLKTLSAQYLKYHVTNNLQTSYDGLPFLEDKYSLNTLSTFSRRPCRFHRTIGLLVQIWTSKSYVDATFTYLHSTGVFKVFTFVSVIEKIRSLSNFPVVCVTLQV